MTDRAWGLVHLSDLHFGRERPALVAALVETVAALAPVAVVLTGDFTQRARSAQFGAAADFLAALPKPLVIAPGNHDMPLYNLPLRLLASLGAYRDHLSVHGRASAGHEAACIVALDSTQRFSIERGRIARRELARARELFAHAQTGALRVVALHHPPTVPPDVPRHKRLAGADATLDEFVALGIDVILSGHTHRPHVEVVDGMLSVTAGSAVSDRHHDHGNSFFRLEWTAAEVRLTEFRHEPGAGAVFVPSAPRCFARRAR